MIHELRFSARHSYDSKLDGITVHAVLKSAEKTVEVLAKIDTGAANCLFAHEIGEALGLRVEDGVRQTFRTANSWFEAYAHEMSLEVLGVVTLATVYFFADPGICKERTRAPRQA